MKHSVSVDDWAFDFPIRLEWKKNCGASLGDNHQRRRKPKSTLEDENFTPRRIGCEIRAEAGKLSCDTFQCMSYKRSAPPLEPNLTEVY